MTLKAELQRLGLLAEGAHLPPGQPPLVALCDAGVLDGGLTIALDLRPDELIGPLCERIGGVARSLKILDVREDPEDTLIIDAGNGEESWEVRDPRDLVERCNDQFRDDAEARAVAVLGEWEDSLQLWCIPKRALSSLLRAVLQAENRARLSAWSRPPRISMTGETSSPRLPDDVVVRLGRLGEQRGRPRVEEREGREQGGNATKANRFRDDRVHDCSLFLPSPAVPIAAVPWRRPPSPAIAWGPGKGSFPVSYLLGPGLRRMQERAVPVSPPRHCMSSSRGHGFLAPFFTALALFALLHAYVARRLFVDPVLPLPVTIAGCLLLALLVVLVPVGFVFSRRDRGWPSRVFPPLAVAWLGASGVVLTVTVVTDLGRLLYGLLYGWPAAAAALSQARMQALLIAIGTALLVPSPSGPHAVGWS
jgi:hypothetical protein